MFIRHTFLDFGSSFVPAFMLKSFSLTVFSSLCLKMFRSFSGNHWLCYAYRFSPFKFFEVMSCPCFETPLLLSLLWSTHWWNSSFAVASCWHWGPDCFFLCLLMLYPFWANRFGTGWCTQNSLPFKHRKISLSNLLLQGWFFGGKKTSWILGIEGSLGCKKDAMLSCRVLDVRMMGCLRFVILRLVALTMIWVCSNRFTFLYSWYQVYFFR
jgi:hypothetical protein